MQHHRRIFVAAAGLLLAWGEALPAAAEPIAFKAGIADASNSVLAWWMAETGGFFAQPGLKVEIVAAGGNRGLEALQAGRLDVMHRGLSNADTISQFPRVSTRLDDYIDASLLDEIRQEGFITALQQRYNLH
jgi:ABC-type amino acid transport substrate-binding protein